MTNVVYSARHSKYSCGHMSHYKINNIVTPKKKMKKMATITNGNNRLHIHTFMN